MFTFLLCFLIPSNNIVISDPAGSSYDYEYFYAPENSFGMGNAIFKNVNWTYFRQLFNQYVDWSLEYKRYSYSSWADGSSYLTIEKTWNESGFWKFNLILDVPVDIYSARFTFGVDIVVSDYIERNGSVVEFSVPTGDGDYYNVYYDWNDLLSVPNLELSKGIFDDKFWFRFKRDNIPSGHYEFDPIFGYNGGVSTGSYYDDRITGNKYPMGGSDGLADNMSIYIDSGWNSGNNITLAIYDGNDLVEQTETRNSGGSGWQTFNLSGTSCLTADKNYTLVGWVEDGNIVVYYLDTGDTFYNLYQNIVYDGSYPDPANLIESGTVDRNWSIYCSYTVGCGGNNAPSISLFNVDAEGSNSWDLDNDDIQIDFTLTDADSDDLTIYMTYEFGFSPTDPSASNYDYVLSSIGSGSYTQTNVDANWRTDGVSDNHPSGTSASNWVDTTTDIYVKLIAYDGTDYSSVNEDTTDRLTGIDGTAPSFSAFVEDADADSGADGYAPDSNYYDDSSYQGDFSGCTDATSGIANYYIKYNGGSYGSADADGSDVSCTIALGDNDIYYKIEDNAGNTAEGDTTDNVFYGTTDPSSFDVDLTGDFVGYPTSSIYTSDTTDISSGTIYLNTGYDDHTWSISQDNSGTWGSGGSWKTVFEAGWGASESSDTSAPYESNTYHSNTGSEADITIDVVNKCGEVQTITLTTTAETTDPETTCDDIPNGNSFPDAITGGSTDNIEVSAVTLYIKDTTDNKYWDGDSWEVALTELTASAVDGTFDSNSESWTYDSSAISDALYHNFEIGAYSTDFVINVDLTNCTDTFIVSAPVGDNCPASSNPSPTNKTINVSIDLGYWNITITDADGDNTNGSIQLSDGTIVWWDNQANGTRSLVLSQLDLDTNYTVFVNFTSETNASCVTNETYWFVTEDILGYLIRNEYVKEGDNVEISIADNLSFLIVWIIIIYAELKISRKYLGVPLFLGLIQFAMTGLAYVNSLYNNASSGFLLAGVCFLFLAIYKTYKGLDL